MGDAPALTPEQLHANWLGWVHVNIGVAAGRDSAAAAAAVESIVAGKGTRDAAAAATNSWLRSGQAGDRLRRMSFWGLVVNDRYVWILVPFVLVAQIFWFVRPLGFIAATCLTVPAVVTLLTLTKGAGRLAEHGVVAPGSLVATREFRGETSKAYESTYQFDGGGPCLVKRTASDAPEDVLVFFDPEHPGHAVVIAWPFET